MRLSDVQVDPLCNMTSETSSSSISFVDPFGVAAGTATGVTHGVPQLRLDVFLFFVF